MFQKHEMVERAVCRGAPEGCSSAGSERVGGEQTFWHPVSGVYTGVTTLSSWRTASVHVATSELPGVARAGAS